jgi:hypothetical protein
MDWMNDDIKNLEKQLEDSAQAEEAELVGDPLPEPEEVVEDEQDEIEEDNEEVVEEEGEEVLPADTPKEGKAWAKMRHSLKERDTELAQMREKLAKIEGFQQAQAEQQKKALEPVEEVPDKDLDPDGYNEWKVGNLEKQLAEMQNSTKETNEQLAAQLQNQNQIRGIEKLEGIYAEDNPDSNYKAAKKFVKQRETEMLKMQHPNATQAQIDAHLQQAEINLFENSLATGGNGADKIMQMAKLYGFEGKQSKAKSNLGNVAKNRKKNASLLGGSAAAKGDGVTADQILNKSVNELMNLTDSEIEKALANQ